MFSCLQPHGLQHVGLSCPSPISRSLPKFIFTESVMPSNHLIFCHPLLFLPSIFPSIKVFSNDAALCIRWPKCWNFNFTLRPSNDHSEFISFRINCFDLLAVQGTFFFVLPFTIYLFFFLLYNIVLVLQYINMNPPWVYTCSPS